MQTTIDESKRVITKAEKEQTNFNEMINKHMELTCQPQKEKYEGKPQRVVEPNLSKRMEARKERAALRAMLAENEKFVDAPNHLQNRVSKN